VFKKSEEQEWMRFRGALGREREESPPDDPAEHQSPTSTASSTTTPNTGASQSAGPSFRPSTGDVNVTVPSRLSRGSGLLNGQEAESVIGERTSFEGTFKSEGGVRVLGSVQGELETKGALFIEEKAQVNARVSAGEVTVAGRMEGQIHCPGRVEIRSTGRVTGEIHTGALIVQEGAFFDGNSKMEGATGSPRPIDKAAARGKSD
jgi:cytoskeletal protein CcmA (bactofilin family)